MKIKVTIERDCCDVRDDLVPFTGQTPVITKQLKPKFCKHCGQLWILESFTDAAGDTDTEYVRYQ